MTMDSYYSGAFHEAVGALCVPVQGVESVANNVLRVARQTTVWPGVAEVLEREAERLEKATATLREAAALAKPNLYLVAAE